MWVSWAVRGQVIGNWNFVGAELGGRQLRYGVVEV